MSTIYKNKILLFLLCLAAGGALLVLVFKGNTVPSLSMGNLLACLKTDQSYLHDLNSSNILLQQKAIFYLGEDKKKAAVPALLKILKSTPIRGIKLETIIALGKIGDKRACLDLIVQCTAQDTEISAAACTSLGQLKAKSAVPALLHLAQDPTRDLQTRLAAIWSLGNIGDPKAIPCLEKLLQNNNQYIAFNASKALKALGKQEEACRP